MLDLIIKNVQITDGSGAPSYTGDLGVRDGLIVENPSGEAREEINGTGLTVCPGFIDAHAHTDRMLGQLDELAQVSRLGQGVTTDITGQCGATSFPVTDTAEWFRMAEHVPKALNYAIMAGHGSIRQKVMDYRDGAPNDKEMAAMKAHVREAMEAGCLGLSSGLIYIPGVYSSKEELAELAKETKPYGGVYATHMRSEADHVVEGVKEAIYVAETAGVPLFISHHKVMGLKNAGASVETLRLIHEAIARGLPVTMDQYPYEATSSALSNSIPPEYFTDGLDALAEKLRDPSVRAEIRRRILSENPGYNCGMRNAGGWDRVLLASSPETPDARGLSVEEYGKRHGMDAFDAFFELLLANHFKIKGVFFSICEEDIYRIYCDENTVVGSDLVIDNASDQMHPRAYGTFARSIRLFHKEKHLVSFEEAIRKQTSLTAERWGIKNKGLLKDGYDADLVLLDYDNFADRATYADPRQGASGLDSVFVAGTCVWKNGSRTGAMPGRLLRR